MGLIIDTSGKPLTDHVRGKARAEAGGSPPGIPPGMAPYLFPYDAANWLTQEMGNWLPVDSVA